MYVYALGMLYSSCLNKAESCQICVSSSSGEGDKQ